MCWHSILHASFAMQHVAHCIKCMLYLNHQALHVCCSAEPCTCTADKVQSYAGDGTQWLAEQHMPMGKLVISCVHTCMFANYVTNKHGHTAGCTDFCQNPFVMLLCLQRLSSGPLSMQSLGHLPDCLCRQCMCNCSAQIQSEGCFRRLLLFTTHTHGLQRHV